MDPQSIIWVIIALIWMVFSGLNSKRKKEAEQQKRTGAPTEKKPDSRNPMEEVLRELQRRAETIETPEVRNPKPVVAKTIKTNKHQVSNKQEVIKGKEVFSMEEKRKSLEYDEYVREQRRKEHDAENRHLEEKIQGYYTEVENDAIINITLRDMVIADAILNRPYADR